MRESIVFQEKIKLTFVKKIKNSFYRRFFFKTLQNDRLDIFVQNFFYNSPWDQGLKTILPKALIFIFYEKRREQNKCVSACEKEN